MRWWRSLTATPTTLVLSCYKNNAVADDCFGLMPWFEEYEEQSLLGLPWKRREFLNRNPSCAKQHKVEESFNLQILSPKMKPQQWLSFIFYKSHASWPWTPLTLGFITFRISLHPTTQSSCASFPSLVRSWLWSTMVYLTCFWPFSHLGLLT